MKIYRRLLKYLHPEVTYRISHILMKYCIIPIEKLCNTNYEVFNTRFKILNVDIPIPIGVGAGIDKNGELIHIFSKISGFHVVGSVTLHPRSGNRHPRLYRYVDKFAMLNAMGLPSKGFKYVVARLERLKVNIPIICNIAGFSNSEFIIMSKILNNIENVKIVEINISCPQYRGVDLHNSEILDRLLEDVRSVCRKPILVKVRPRSLDVREIVKICEKYSNVGLTISNSFSTITSCMSSGVGGFSGLPIYRLVKRIVKYVREFSDIEIVACGGIFHGKQVYELLEKYGVSAVQIVTAIAFEGPYAICRIVKEFLMYYR